jgi:hypothetical protein
MEKKHFFDSPENLKKFLKGFFASLVVLIVIDLFVHKHPYFALEGYPSFYATFGFVACVVLVLAARYILRPLIKRREDYYD